MLYGAFFEGGGWGQGVMGGVLHLFQNSPYFFRNVVEQTAKTFLELF